MNLFEHAKEMEQQGMAFYHSVAENCGVAEISGIFSFLEAEEKRHYEIFDSWSKKVSPPDLDESVLPSTVAEAFKKLSSSYNTEGAAALDAGDAFEKALSMEQGAVEYYTALLEKVEDDSAKIVLAAIIAQEQKHVHLMESLGEFQREPKEYIENAEWNNFG